jgi:hypothetical protein
MTTTKGFDLTTIEEARTKCAAARKAASEGRPALARELYSQAADRYQVAGLRLVAANVARIAKELPR